MTAPFIIFIDGFLSKGRCTYAALLVHLYRRRETGGSSLHSNKKTFFFFYPHTLTIRLKRPVYRGFSGEGKCEGKFLPSHPHNPSEMPCLSEIQGCEGKD